MDNIEELKKHGDIISLHEITRLINMNMIPDKKVIVIGGSPEIPGAPLLTLRAAKRCGAKAVVLASSQNVIGSVDIMYAGALRLYSLGRMEKSDYKKLLPIIPGFGCVVIGPGLYPNKKQLDGIRYFLSNYSSTIPLIIDANVIDLVGSEPELLGKIKAPVIMTPNKKELGRLTKIDLSKASITSIVSKAKAYAKEHHVHLIVKGPIDIITNGEKTHLNIAGQPVFAVAGSGDCVAGCIAGFISLSNTPLASISAGIYVFSRAGTYCYNDIGYSLDPEAILNMIPKVMKEILDFNTVAEFRHYTLYDPDI